MGHFCSLHVRYSTFAGQPIPPWPAAVVIERERDCVPRAQLALHTVQLLQAVYWQSMGHAKALHDLVLEVLGQATPPCWVAVTTDRLRDFEPPPHDFEQLENADQLETLQSTGQPWMLHTRLSRVGHSSPPCLAAMSTA